MPQVEVHLALSGGAKWGGIGEPAVANAIHLAIGKRIRSTPLENHDLSWTRNPALATIRKSTIASLVTSNVNASGIISILQLKLRNPNTADHERTRQQKKQRQGMQSVARDTHGTHPKVRPNGVLRSGKC